MVFDDIVGQSNVIKNIKNALTNGRIAHAYLFCGPDGVGKSIAASTLAGALNCRNRGTDPCGVCPSCIRARDGNHPDIIHVRARKHAKSEKLSISVDDIRDVQMDMQKKPYEEGIKVYIIHDAEKITEQAENALLKILEEPPSYIVIILLTNKQYSLLGTILSRCQIIKFSRAPEKEIENYLIAKMGTSKDQARYIAAFSDGIVKKALEFLNDEDFKKNRDKIVEMSKELYQKDKINILSYVDYFIGNKDRIDSVLDMMMSWFRDIMIFKECKDSKYLINLDKADIIASESSKFTYSSLYKIIKIIKETADKIKSNVNFQLSIEIMLLSIQEG